MPKLRESRIPLGALPLIFACAGGDAPAIDDSPGAAGDAFCASVTPAVDAFVSRSRTAHPIPAGDTRYGGQVVVGANAELANGMNVVAASDYNAIQHHQFVNLMTLIRYDEALEPQPYLAASWELTDDDRTLTFRLRDDVFWHDGEPVDARDVAFTYRMVTHPDAGFPNAAFWDRYDTGPQGAVVVDDRTVRFRLEPQSEPLDPWRSVAILPEHLLGRVPVEGLREHPFSSRCPVGNGPFVFREHVSSEHWVFEANPAFPQALGGRPFVDRYVYRIVPDANTLLLELLTGGIDVYVAAQPDQAEAIVDSSELDLVAFPFRSFTFVAWNSRRPLLADARVRRALTLGLDREQIVAALLEGFGTVAHGTVPGYHWAHAERVGRLPYDPERARSLLNEAGFVDRDGDGVRENAEGTPLSLSLQTNQGNARLERLAVIAQAQLKEIGVDVRVEVREWASMIEAVTDPERRDFDGVTLSWVTEFKLDDTDLFHSDRVDQPYGFSGTANPDIDRLLETLQATPDRDEARTLWADYQDEIAREQPFTFFYSPDRLAGVNRRLRDVRMDARGEWLNVREWWIDPDRR